MGLPCPKDSTGMRSLFLSDAEAPSLAACAIWLIRFPPMAAKPAAAPTHPRLRI